MQCGDDTSAKRVMNEEDFVQTGVKKTERSVTSNHSSRKKRKKNIYNQSNSKLYTTSIEGLFDEYHNNLKNMFEKYHDTMSSLKQNQLQIIQALNNLESRLPLPLVLNQGGPLPDTIGNYDITTSL